MSRELESAFALEIRFQAAAAKLAFDRLERLVTEWRALARQILEIRKGGGPPPLEIEQRQYSEMVLQLGNKVPAILDALQSFLASCGVVSMILWPDPRIRPRLSEADVQARVSRGAIARELFHVGDDSPLKALRQRETDPRGGLLHIDELFEEFVLPPTARGLITFQMGSQTETQGWDPEATLRWLDDETLTLNVGGRRAELRALIDELHRIANQIQVTAREELVLGSHSQPSSLPVGMAVDPPVRRHSPGPRPDLRSRPAD